MTEERNETTERPYGDVAVPKENLTPEELYARAAEVMDAAKTEVAFRSAAKMFGMTGGIKDADARAQTCLERAEICRKDALYDLARSQMAEDSVSGYEAAARNLKAIPGWKDADALIPVCEEGAQSARERNENTQQRANEERRKKARKRKKIVVAVCLAAAFCLLIAVGLIVLERTVIGPSRAYSAAVDLYNEGAYERAMTAFLDLKGYKDSDEWVGKCRQAINDPVYYSALVLYNEGKYDEAIAAFKNLNGYRDSEKMIKECHAILLDRIFAFQKAGLKDAAVGATVRFGLYEQFDLQGSGQEEIEWLVLAKEGNKILMISRCALDCQLYNYADAEQSWENSYIRSWLNGAFYEEAFGTEHRKMIVETAVDASTEPGGESSGTLDKVFLLSTSEAERYFSSNEARECTPTLYALALGAWKNTETLANGRVTCWWWLRSPGFLPKYAARVRSDGSVDGEGSVVFTVFNAVRPVVWIDLDAS